MIYFWECPCKARYSPRVHQGILFEFSVGEPDHCIRCGAQKLEFTLRYGPCATERVGDWPYSEWENARFQAWRNDEPLPEYQP